MLRLHLKYPLNTIGKHLFQQKSLRTLSTKPLQPKMTPLNEEHMLSNTKLYSRLLANLNLENITVVEFGAGDGVLTEIILKQNPRKLIAYELSESLAIKLKNKLHSPALDLRIADFTKVDFSYLNQGNHVIISNPPYSTIPFLQEQIINVYKIPDIIMMTSLKKKQKYFSDYQLAFRLGPNDFTPPADGEHLVVQKGFTRLMKAQMILPLIEMGVPRLLSSSSFKEDMIPSADNINDFEVNSISHIR